MSEGISVRLIGAEDGAQGGAAGSPFLLRLDLDAGWPEGGRFPAWHRVCGEAATALRPGRPGRRPGRAMRPPSRPRRLIQGNAPGHARGTWQWQEVRHWQPRAVVWSSDVACPAGMWRSERGRLRTRGPLRK
eukprot:2052531-Pleurochrysis_carterae.AAC.1